MSFWKKNPPPVHPDPDPEFIAYQDQLANAKVPHELPEWSMLQKHGTLAELYQAIGLMYEYARINLK
jgi:hypothetical protein